MVSPGCPGKPFGLVVSQPLQSERCFVQPLSVPVSFMQPQETPCEEAHPLSGMTACYADQGTQIEGESADALLKGDAKVLIVECQRAQKPCIEAIKCVITLVVVSLKPIRQLADGFIHACFRPLAESLDGWRITS